MALVNAAYQMPSYTDDFGTAIANIPLKFGDDVTAAILTGMGYALRTASVGCGGVGKLFDLRVLVATFGTGAVHRFPVNRSEIIAKRDFLLENGAVCVNLEGESWNLVPSTRFAAGTAFKTTPYGNIQSRALRQTVSFNYLSDVIENAVRISTSIEVAPTELNDCQKAGLDTPQIQGGGICSASSIGIEPRKYIIQAIATKQGDAAGTLRRVVRQAIVSPKTSADILTKIAAIAPCAYCVGYKGESISNLELF